MKEVRTKIENGSCHVSTLLIGPGIVTIEMIGITETGIGIGTEIGKGNEREIVDVIEIEIVDVIEIVVGIGIGRGTVTGIEVMIVIVKGIGIMKVVKLIGDARMTGRLIMIKLNLNTRKIVMVREIMTMNLRMIVGGTTNLCMDIGMLILTMILITITPMIIIEDGSSMMMEMITVTITINILIMIGWKMTTTLRGQNLNHAKGREIVI